MKKLENIFFVLAVIIFFVGALVDSQKIINLSLFVLVLMMGTYFFSFLISKFPPKGGQSPVFVDSPERLKFLVDKEEFLKQLESDPNFNNEGQPVIIDPNGNGPCQSRSLSVKDLYEEVRKESKIGIKFTKLFAKDRDGEWDQKETDDKADNPWAQCVNVDYDKYLAMKDKCIAELRELPNQDIPQFMWSGGSWSPKHLAQQITDQTTVGKEYVEMRVETEEDDDEEEDPNDT